LQRKHCSAGERGVVRVGGKRERAVKKSQNEKKQKMRAKKEEFRAHALRMVARWYIFI
jgi:hypothetical protein